MVKQGRMPGRKRGLSFSGKKAVVGYLFILPFIIGFITLFVVPLVRSFQFSMNDIRMVTGGYEFIPRGWSHYARALTTDADFRRDLATSFSNLAFNLPTILVFSFFAANLLNRKFRGRGAARTIFFLPVVLTAGVIAAVESGDLLLSIAQGSYANEMAANGSGGLQLESMLMQMNLPTQFTSFVVGAVNNLYGIVSQSGVQILIFLAALQSIPSSLYEASTIEGATAWDNFCKISFPMVSPYILVNAVYTVIDSFTASGNAVMQRVTTTSIDQFEYGYGSAMAWIYVACILVMLLVVVGIISRFVFYYDR